MHFSGDFSKPLLYIPSTQNKNLFCSSISTHAIAATTTIRAGFFFCTNFQYFLKLIWTKIMDSAGVNTIKKIYWLPWAEFSRNDKISQKQ